MDPHLEKTGKIYRCSKCHIKVKVKNYKILCPECEFVFDEYLRLNCTRCNFGSNSRIIFELHLFFARHNYLIWRKK